MTAGAGPVRVVARLGAAAGRLRHRRAPLALVVGGLSSAGNFLLAVTVTRLETVGGVGRFAVAFSFYVLVSGLVRAMVTDTVLAAAAGAAPAARRATLVGVVAGGLVLAAGAATGSRYLLLAGAALPGLVLYDHAKAVALGVGAPRRALRQEGAWAALTVLAVLPGLLRLVGPETVFAGWAVGGALLGLVAAGRRGYGLLPGWSAGRTETRTALGFGAQFLVTTGSAQLALTAMAGLAGTAVVGALSAGRTILGPVNLVVSTASTLILPHLARTRDATTAVRTRAAVRLVLLVTAGALPMALAVALLPDGVGTALLGANWALAQGLLPLLALESLLAVPAAVGFAGLRIERASGRAVVVGVVLGVLRVPVVVAGAVLVGAGGAAVALVVMALLSALAWGRSYQLLLRRRAAERPLVAQPA
ncbi:MATE family efflux transporter [Micromonospora rosaria]|uniref:hypothetical protein n=1 Tax=Micromonospora rosaria TaxID=47874 RepID=UPI000A73B627|nr:hypothetical protein [Micromonospora rosaria]